MTPKTAASLLSLPLRGPWTADEVGAAYRDALRRAHPDHGGSGDISSIQQARDALLKEAAKLAALVTCPRCEGTGRMETRSGRRISCSTCDGSGEYRDKEIRRG